MAAAILPNLERAIYTAFFQAADRDKNGYLTIDELAEVTKLCGLTLTPKEITDVFLEMDTNNDWKITLDEFISGMNSLNPEKRRVAAVRRLLLEADSERKGYLNYQTIQNIIRDVPDISHRELEETLDQMNIADLNKVDYNRFIQRLEQKLS